jgi:VWFA-related protein
MKRLAVLFAAACIAAPLFAQNPTPQYGEKIEVNAVLVDAIVTDRSGHQILGLDKNDFVVKENGVPQQIESVDYFTNRRLLTSPEQLAAFKVERVREERYFIFFFDRPTDNSYFDRLTLARQAAKNFVLKDMLPTDRVAVVGDDVRLKVFSDFTSDKSQLIAALNQSAGFGRGLMAKSGSGPESIMANIDVDAMINHTGTVYEALEVLANATRQIHARKNLLLFSPGIREIGEEIRGGLIVSQSRYYEPMLRALNTADVSVYGMNLNEAGLIEPEWVHQNLERIAKDTSGDYYRHVVNFQGAVNRIENENNGYYLITYYAHHPRGTSGYQKISVSLKNPEFIVKAREGYAY